MKVAGGICPVVELSGDKSIVKYHRLLQDAQRTCDSDVLASSPSMTSVCAVIQAAMARELDILNLAIALHSRGLVLAKSFGYYESVGCGA